MQIPYDRLAAVEYAREWAFGRNPDFYNFDNLGGDCTNFVSQCVYAGCGVMNYTPTFGWYYISLSSRAPAWTGVPYFYNFIVHNREQGPYAEETTRDAIELGDVIQLGQENGEFYHSLLVTGIQNGRIYIAAHSNNAYMRPLDSYIYDQARYLHILGARKDD